jgi:hypothetical protein
MILKNLTKEYIVSNNVTSKSNKMEHSLIQLAHNDYKKYMKTKCDNIRNVFEEILKYDDIFFELIKPNQEKIIVYINDRKIYNGTYCKNVTEIKIINSIGFCYKEGIPIIIYEQYNNSRYTNSVHNSLITKNGFLSNYGTKIKCNNTNEIIELKEHMLTINRTGDNYEVIFNNGKMLNNIKIVHSNVE